MKKGLGRGLGTLVPLEPVGADGDARLDDAIRRSAGPPVLSLSGETIDDIVRQTLALAPVADTAARGAPTSTTPTSTAAAPVLRSSGREPVASAPDAATDGILPSADIVAVPPEEPAPDVRRRDANDPRQFSLFDASSAPGAVSESAARPAPVTARVAPEVVPAVTQAVAQAVAPTVPTVAAPIDDPVVSDVYLDDMIVFSDPAPEHAEPAPEPAPAPVAVPAAPPPVSPREDAVFLDDDLFVGGIVLPDVELE
ncbi:MAG: hypothetical protein HMLKMBBP_01400 [Planctomycetes bacterium]|nr:hypothetical protein [Planctomycetota bacterium]